MTAPEGVVFYGTAGTPAGGVATVQGVTGGTPIPVSGAGNSSGTLFALAARTTNQTSATIANPGGIGAHIVLRVTVASGTGGLLVRIQGIDALGNVYYLNNAPTAVTATGIYVYELFPGSSGGVIAPPGIAQRTSGVLPPSFSVFVNVGDASSYTYSLAYAIM